MELSGKIVLVTGSSAGLGEDIARTLTDEGATVLGWGHDFTDEGLRTEALAQIERRYGRLDALINAAVLDVRGPVANAKATDFRALVETNYLAPMLLNFAALSLLRAGRGHIFNVSSLEARDMRPGAAAYAATLGALAAYTESLRKDMATHGIRVTLVLPAAGATEVGEAIADALAHPARSVVSELVVRGFEVKA